MADDKPVSDGNPVSVRLPADVVTALRQRSRDGGESMSDALRRGALMVLGICPTCERPVERQEGGGT